MQKKINSWIAGDWKRSMNKYLKLTWDEIKKSICSEIRYPGKDWQDRDPGKGAQHSLTTDRSSRSAWTSFLLIITHTKKITMKVNTKSRVTRLDMKITNKKQFIWHIRRKTGLGDVALCSLERER